MEKLDYLQLAINKSWEYQFLTFPNPAVGATVVQNDTILSVEAHQKAGFPHAEVNALKSAYLKKNPNSKLSKLTSSHEIHEYLIKNHNDYFIDCTIYVTLEPCNHTGKTPSCASLLKELKIKKVVIGILDSNDIASGGKETLEHNNIQVEVLNDNRCEQLLFPFLKWQQDKFVFFKLAMREDGSIDGGYITTQDSLTLVHNIRTKIDLLVIGGETVRKDQPTLDTRFTNENKNPNILIYSRNKMKDFDKNIKLFGIKNRTVDIASSLEILENKKLIMVEGGYNLLDMINTQLDMLMIFISHKIKTNFIFDIEKYGFKIVHRYYINKDDEVVFLVRDTTSMNLFIM